MRSLERPIFVLALTAAFLCLPTTVAAQDLDNVTIEGQVTDQNKAVIPGAIVTATIADTRVERRTTTNGDGRYRLIQLPPGRYSIKAAFTNFAAEEKSDLAAFAGQNLKLDFTLKPGELGATPVVVTGNSALIDTTRMIVGGTITSGDLETLPIASRSPLDLIFTLGGVSEEPLSTRDLAEDRTSARSTPEEAGNFSLSGGPAYSNNITIDGLDNNDDRAARERFSPSMESVAEVQVIRNQFAAEYGRASGGRINLRTRSGANKFHGRGFYFFRDESLDANTWKNNSLGLARLPLQEHDPGFTLSGPVVIPKLHDGHQRTFFFTAYEYDAVLDSTLIDTLVPLEQNPRFVLPAPTLPSAPRLENATPPALNSFIAPFVSSVNTPAHNHILTARVDRQISDRHDIELLYQIGRLNNLRQFGGGNRLAQALLGKTRNSDSIAFLDNYVLSARAVAQTRFQWSRLTPAIGAGGGVHTPVVLIGINDPADLFTGTLVAGTSTSGATDRRESRVQMQEIFTSVIGNHALRFGGDVHWIKSTFIDLSDATGTYNFASAGDFLANTPNRFRQNFQTTSTQRNTYVGLFVQDEWRWTPNLTLSFGVRWENESIVRDQNNFAPRFALAFDPFKSGKTVIRAGAGIFYNRALLRTIDDFTLGAQQLFFDTNSLSSLVTGRLMSADERRAFIAANLQFPQTLTTDSDLVKRFGVLNTGFSRRLDPTLRIPESYQVNVGLERELGKNIALEANYTYNRGLHLWREFNVNAPRLPNGFTSFSQYLVSRDFTNFRSSPTGPRPLYDASSAGDLVRFQPTPLNPSDPNAITRLLEFGLAVSVFNLNSFSSGTPVAVALAALNSLRPDPTRAEVEQLIAVGNSFYHGVTLELRNRFRHANSGAGLSFRAAYTLSFLKDDGIVNTSDALTPGDFRSERSRSLLDRRHRLTFSGTVDTPRYLGRLQFSPVLRVASAAPFNISIGGADRNLDDVANDRPIFNGDTSRLKWRRPGEPFDVSILDQFALPTIGLAGNLPRNAGTGPAIFVLDLSVTREFKAAGKLRVRPVVECDNLLNMTVFSFGSEFIDFNAIGPAATLAQKQAFIDSFLVATRTLRPRQIRLGVRLDF